MGLFNLFKKKKEPYFDNIKPEFRKLLQEINIKDNTDKYLKYYYKGTIKDLKALIK